MNRLKKIELERNIKLPEIYKEFYAHCSIEIPKQLVGSSLINNEPDLQEGAINLLIEDSAEFSLQENDFVFFMHQGYQFCYFKADGNPDPEVFYYMEGKRRPINEGPLSAWISVMS